ncbi:MAG: glycosyltransferase family 9 protein [Deltaproteobacteria bacterium]|nr:glycosyltransferase family 9 protein [Deltaproteobacteria bacterium]MBI3294466.1 glycosyltransferase family 9 protein [Deltaproteobacteria bacterium]
MPAPNVNGVNGVNRVSDNIHRILILRFSSLGDIVMATAMIRCLRARFPAARIDMVVREDFLELIEHNPHLDLKMGLSRETGWRGLWRLYQRLKHNDYDLIYDAHFSLRSRILSGFLRPRLSAHYQKHYLRRSLALTFKIPLLKHFDRMVVRYIAPLERWGVAFDKKGPELPCPPQTRLERPQIGFIPSAQWPGKRWGQFTELARLILEKTDWNITLFAGPGDGFASSIARDLDPTRVHNLQGRLSLKETTVELKKCHLVIANDTGLMHMADALGVPPVVILGPTAKELGCEPFHPLHRIIEKTLWCRPCSKNGQAPCIRGRRVCLEIAPEVVLEEARHVVEQLKHAP